MAFIQKDLCTIGTGGNNSLHMYSTNDLADTLEDTEDYFLPAYRNLKVGDFILASVDMDGTPAGKIYWVAASSSAAVTLGFISITAVD